MDGANKQDRREGQPEFFRRGGRWYFGKNRVASFGPFDQVLDIVMGEWKSEQRELEGEAIIEALWPGSESGAYSLKI